MRRHMLAAVAATLGLMLAGCGGDDPDPPPPPPHSEDATTEVTVSPELAGDLATMRAATATYANDLDAARADGYFVITPMMDDMGYHFLNPDFSADGFDASEPPILVYGRDGDDWQLVAVEWVFPEEPAEPPLEGASYGAFPAACHYEDGEFVAAAGEGECAGSHPDTDAGFTFWHPDLVTLHAWVWLHNPAGLYHGTNPLMAPYNGG